MDTYFFTYNVNDPTEQMNSNRNENIEGTSQDTDEVKFYLSDGFNLQYLFVIESYQISILM